VTNFRSRSQAVLSRVRFPQLSVQVSVQSEIYSVAGKTYRHTSLPRKLIVTFASSTTFLFSLSVFASRNKNNNTYIVAGFNPTA